MNLYKVENNLGSWYVAAEDFITAITKASEAFEGITYTTENKKEIRSIKLLGKGVKMLDNGSFSIGEMHRFIM